MSWSSTTTVWCDGRVDDETGVHDCGSWIYGPDGEGVRGARRNARRKGWRCGPSGDFCQGPHVALTVDGTTGDGQ